MHLMHHWDSVPDSAVAPSPVVPTCRRDHTYKPPKPPKRSKSSMASSVSGSPESTVSRGSVARHQARSAGMAERPSRNESLSDLVRFFQTQNVPTGATMSSPDTTTALPAVESPEQKEVSKEQLKPLHRRLLHFTQRQKKESTKSKSSDHQRQIEALQREGYLLPAPKPKDSPHRSSGSVDRSSNSLDQVLSKSKRQDVETIGQPWLQNKSTDTGRSSYSKRRLASLDLDDFGSMVDVAVSLSEYDDPSPPPYQPSGSAAAVPRGDSAAASHSTPASQSDISSSGPSHRNSDWLMSPSTSTSFAETQRSGSFEEHGPRPTSSNSSIRIIDEDTQPVPKPKAPAQVSNLESSKPETRETTQDQPSTVDHNPQPQEPQNPPPQPPTNPSPPSLKLFPDVAPPRNSSKKAFRLSSAPRYQTPAKPASSASSDACSDTETPKPPPQKQPQATRPPSASSNTQKDGVASSGALDKPANRSGTRSEAKTTTKAAPPPMQSKVRPPSLAMNTLQAFPLPAPTRPLPSVPKSSSLGVPADPKIQTPVRNVRSGPTALNIQASQPSPIPEEPRELELRPATVLGHVTTAYEASVDDSGPGQSVQVTPERPKSTSPEQSTPRRRAASFHASSLRGLPESPPDRYDCSSEGLPVADSPVLGQQTPTKPFGKRAVRKGLEINSRIGRKDLPFGLPSPPPSAALPADPPIQQNAARSGHRNYTAPIGAGSSKTLDLAFNPASHRSSLISRSNSSRSSLRHESIPESSEPSHAGSPLPSSDDECFGPRTGPKRSHRAAEKTQQRQRPNRRGYETFDGRASSQRARLVPPMRSLTPQGRSSYGTENSASPMSQYSQSTFRSCESLNNARPQAPSNDVAQLFEDRIANLERQNQILQAALMAALNASVKPNMPNINLHESAVPSSFHAPPPNHPYPSRSASRPDSWMSSSHGSEQGSYEANSSRYSRGNAH